MTDVHLPVRYFGRRQTSQERKNHKVCYSSNAIYSFFLNKNLKIENKTILCQELA